MHRRLYTLALVLLLVMACQPELPANPAPTVIAFPTMTPGRVLQGPLPDVANVPAAGSLANPATAVALVSRPSPTPDYAQCPRAGDAELGSKPDTSRAMLDAMARFLSSGGAALALEAGLRDRWQALGDTGTLRSDYDLTGEGVPEILVAFETPDDAGLFAIFTCTDGRYIAAYQWAPGGSAPRVAHLGDMTFDGGRPEVLVMAEVCQGDACAYRTQLAQWDPGLGRFVSLLDREIETDSPPQLVDIDNDEILEIVVEATSSGTARTGPLRTGSTIYDWNGAAYVQSITRLDPPRYRIQVVHEADRALERGSVEEAISLYTLALNSSELRPWHDDEEPILRSYILYRLLIAHAAAGDDQAQPAFQQILEAFPDGASAPVYVPLSTTFWNAMQVTNSVRSACREVRDEIEASRPEAVDLMNRYGSRSPVYDARDICPY